MGSLNTPKVLVINVISIDDHITMRNLFDGYPPEKLMQLLVCRNVESHSSYHTHSLDSFFLSIEVCLRKLISRVFSMLGRRAGGAKIVSPGVPQKGLKSSIHECVRGLIDIVPIPISKEVISALKAFKPDVIYTLGANIRVLSTVYSVARRLNKNIVLHVMDNWIETLYTTSFLSYLPRKRLDAVLRKVHTLTLSCLAISPQMARVYERRFGVNYSWIMNTVKKVDPAITAHHSSVFQFVYAGGLHLNRWMQLLEIAKSIEALEQSNHKTVELHIYTSDRDIDRYKSVLNLTCIQLHQFIPHERIFTVLSAADVLVHVESFEENIIEFTKYSISTKIPEYMSVGKPILCFAPIGIASEEIIRCANAGMSVNNKVELDNAIAQLVIDDQQRMTYINNGVLFSKEHFISEMVQARLVNVLLQNSK